MSHLGSFILHLCVCQEIPNLIFLPWVFSGLLNIMYGSAYLLRYLPSPHKTSHGDVVLLTERRSELQSEASIRLGAGLGRFMSIS